MPKIALFVEGQAEQIFIREMLLRRFAYNADDLQICCLRLIAEKLEPAEYDYGKEDALNHFLIINAGNDNKVLSVMLRRHAGLISKGYQMIIGLRDMYSRFYREQSASVVNQKLNKEIISAARQQIKDKDVTNVKIHFAIMEVETWMLAMLDKWKGALSKDDISKYFNLDSNLEEIFHPSEVVKALTGLYGPAYDKHSSQVNSIMANISWEDYSSLYRSDRCPSFNLFIDDLNIMQ